MRDQLYYNSSVINLTDIGEGHSAALLCLTDNTQCCKGGHNPSRALGHWYFPDGTPVPDGLDASRSIYRNRGPSVVRLNRRNNAQSPTGLYRCEIPDASGTNQTLYVGVYTTDIKGMIHSLFDPPIYTQMCFLFTVSPTITNIHFDALSQALTCVSSNSPATTVHWQINSTAATVNTTQLQRVVNASEAVYENILFIMGDPDAISGDYTCVVSNSKGSDSKTYSVNCKAHFDV